jgi:curved DNA-binding protein CbpA
MYHHFSLDPRTILGVNADATGDEIHSSFLAKSKKYHPDHGGDEWAFKMVVRAYEILKATDDVSQVQRSPQPATQAEHSTSQARAKASASPSGQFRTVEAELVWIRCEGSPRLTTSAQLAAMTLSVCLVISWPEAALVRRSADYPDAAENLRVVIQAFDHLKTQSTVIDSRSRIEDGQFVGWLSYPNVLHAETAFHALRDELELHKLGISLRTRDELVPVDWLER